MKQLKYFISLFLLAVVQLSYAQSSPRSVIDFNKNWKFFLGNDSTAIKADYDDAKWRALNLPHDWSIESDFSKEYPATNQGGALPGGIGWYRKTFVVPASSENKNISIEFDGVYRNSEVWINGHYLGKRPNGYISFQYDITEYIKQAPVKNIIVVKVDNSQQPNSRWYSGSGIYRNVKLIATGANHINDGSLFITTPFISKDSAIVNVSGVIETVSAHYLAHKARVSVLSAEGKTIFAQTYNAGSVNEIGGINYSIKIPHPVLWSTTSPYLYKLKLELLSTRNELLDNVTTSFGIRFFNFDAQKGFFINGKPLKIKGVCMHHDLGALGAAFNKAAAKRQLKILKEMGCNAIRTAHNPPAAEFLDLCDEMGFLVMDEAFDMWQKRKNRYDYHLDFKEWYKRDIEAMVLRDRNHPSVFMWSIGNEIREQFDSTGIALTKELTAIVKALDTTRPVTNALTENFPDKNFIYRSGVLDVLGFNYKLYDYKDLPSRFPGQKILASETVSALATRGVYDQPSDSMRIWPPDSKQPFVKGNPDMTVSAYDHAYAYWGATHEQALQAVNKHDFIAGCFVWSGFDFLGEPVPYPWPARSSYYGIIDLAGFPKDVYYMYQSKWITKPVLHIFPHWNWQVGQVVDVWAYYNNADEVELFLNGRSLGIRKKENDELHVVWRVPFEPGVLKAVSRKNGKIVLTRQIKTAGKPAKIELVADRKAIKADGKDLSFVAVRVLDKNGNLVPDADNLIKFSVSGAGIIAGTDNGYQADTLSLKSHNRKCWKGMALVIIQSSGKKGNITLRADSTGLLPVFLSLKTSD
ncbi:MAG TPA: sugar-binding domain-containing protein [Chitinophagaceae bacterium]